MHLHILTYRLRKRVVHPKKRLLSWSQMPHLDVLSGSHKLVSRCVMRTYGTRILLFPCPGPNSAAAIFDPIIRMFALHKAIRSEYERSRPSLRPCNHRRCAGLWLSSGRCDESGSWCRTIDASGHGR